MTDRSDERPRGRGDVLCRELDDGFVLYDPVQGKVHTLNVVAAFIWESCDGDKTVDGIVEDLKAAPGVGGKDLRAEVQEAIDRFRELGLFETDSSGRQCP